MKILTTLTLKGALGLTRLDGAAMPGLKGNKSVTVVGRPVDGVTVGDLAEKGDEVTAWLERMTGLTVRIETEVVKD